ncbi:MAG: hypothetical protein LC624_10965 [Halobacteriales archaeon]|nr:hypothetical protein [Halobacteriales archaeon]
MMIAAAGIPEVRAHPSDNSAGSVFQADRLELGQVLEQGSPSSGGCEYHYTIAQMLRPNGFAVSYRLESTKDCKLVVVSLLKHPAMKTASDPLEIGNCDGGCVDSAYFRAEGYEQSYGSHNNVVTYREIWMKWFAHGNGADGVDYGGSSAFADELGWVEDGKASLWIPQYGNPVRRDGTADYHHNSYFSSEWYHDLHVWLDGWGDGALGCSHHYHGNVEGGVAGDCYYLPL